MTQPYGVPRINSMSTISSFRQELTRIWLQQPAGVANKLGCGKGQITTVSSLSGMARDRV